MEFGRYNPVDAMESILFNRNVPVGVRCLVYGIQSVQFSQCHLVDIKPVNAAQPMQHSHSGPQQRILTPPHLHFLRIESFFLLHNQLLPSGN